MRKRALERAVYAFIMPGSIAGLGIAWDLVLIACRPVVYRPHVCVGRDLRRDRAG